MFEWLWKRLGGGTKEESDSKKAPKTKKVTATKAKPTAAKAKKSSKTTTPSSSSLTSVRTSNTRPSSSSNAVNRKAKKGTTARSSFDDMYDKLKAYKQANGHCSVPSSYEDDKTLANFVRRVRTQYKKIKEGKKSKGDTGSSVTLTKDQIKKLESIDFEWEAKRGRKAKGVH